jgi:hypothetical protein
MSLSLIRSHIQTAGEHVGDMLWWTLENARISRDRLEEVWQSAGLSMSLLPEPPTPERALRTAVREAQVGHQGHLIRLGKEDDKLQVAVAGIGASRIDVVPVHATPEASLALGAAARSALEEDLAALTSEIEAFLQEPPERVSTLTRRLATFDELRSKAHLYHSVLQVNGRPHPREPVARVSTFL